MRTLNELKKNKNCVSHLIRMRALEQFRLLDKYYLVASNAVLYIARRTARQRDYFQSIRGQQLEIHHYSQGEPTIRYSQNWQAQKLGRHAYHNMSEKIWEVSGNSLNASLKLSDG